MNINVKIIIGCAKLIATVQYLPLRFQCISMLTKLSKHTGKLIPILPHILEVFIKYVFKVIHF